jgi:hypothetical protein
MSNLPHPRALRAPIAIAAATVMLAGCYIVPITPQPPVYNQIGGLPVAPAAATYGARLYPVNDIAARSGMLQASVTDTLNGHGSFTLNFNGEALQGEASRVPDGYPGYGRVHQEVYGSVPRPGGGYRKGVASASGAHGVFVNCEYALNSSAMGTGACLFSNGAKYQLHFGG